MKFQEDLLFAFLLSLFVTYIAWKRKFYRFPFPGNSYFRLSYIYPLLAFLLYFGAMIVVSPMIYFILKANGIGHEVAWTQIIGIPLLILVFIGYLALIKKEVVRSIFVGSLTDSIFFNFWKNIGWGIVTWIICYPVVLFINLLIQKISFALWQIKPVHQEAVEILKRTQETPLIFALLAILVALFVPFLEELIFRGFLQTFFRSYFGRWRALVLTAIIFTAFHFGNKQGWGNVELLISLFVLSLYLGFIYERQKSLWASFGLHAAFNSISVINLAFFS